MPRVDPQSTVLEGMPWTAEDVRIFLALPIHLQATSIYADGVDAQLIVDALRSWSLLGYRSAAHMMLVRMHAAR